MKALAQYMADEHSPMARYIYEKLVIPELSGAPPARDFPSLFLALVESASSNAEFQRVIFGAPVRFVSASMNYDSPGVYAAVRAFGLQGDWLPTALVMDGAPVDNSPRRKDEPGILALFSAAAVGMPAAIEQARMKLSSPPLTVDAKRSWETLCTVDEKAFYVRGALRRRYNLCKEMFDAVYELLLQYLDSTSFYTVVGIMSLISTFNLYDRIQRLNKEFERMKQYVAQLKVDITNPALARAVEMRDAVFLDKAVLQLLRDSKGAQYKLFFSKLNTNYLFKDTIESLLSESML